jgi:hypothetical protein
VTEKVSLDSINEIAVIQKNLVGGPVSDFLKAKHSSTGKATQLTDYAITTSVS